MGAKPKLVAKLPTAERSPAGKASADAKPRAGIVEGVANILMDPSNDLKLIGGSDYLDFNRTLSNQVTRTGWYANCSDEAAREKLTLAIMGGMMGLAPKDEVEGMLAAQMIATHNAAMECFRRAMLPEQTLPGRDMNLTQANKLTRSYATLVQALDKHRGKGQQTVRVEHVHVHSGGQAIVGNVGSGMPPLLPPAPAASQIGKAGDEGMAMLVEGAPLDAFSLAGGGGEVESVD